MATSRSNHGPENARASPLRVVALLLVRPVQFLAFWLAVCLPLVYVPLFAARVLTAPMVLVACLGANVLALLCGHPHNVDRAGRDTGE
jgi:hypothetical protein